MQVIQLLEQLRKGATTGKNFANSQYDVVRYQEMLTLLDQLYQHVSSFDMSKIDPVDEYGYITPKVGVNALIEREDGSILLERRVDDACWCIPGGWSEVGLTAEENIVKEIKEEAGYNVKVERLMGVISRKPNQKFPYTSYHLLFKCLITGGELQQSYESLDVDWKQVDEVDNWHYDHLSWVEKYRTVTN